MLLCGRFAKYGPYLKLKTAKVGTSFHFQLISIQNVSRIPIIRKKLIFSVCGSKFLDAPVQANNPAVMRNVRSNVRRRA